MEPNTKEFWDDQIKRAREAFPGISPGLHTLTRADINWTQPPVYDLNAEELNYWPAIGGPRVTVKMTPDEYAALVTPDATDNPTIVEGSP